MAISLKTTAAIALALASATVSTSVSAATTVNVSTGVNPWTVSPGTAIVPTVTNGAWVGGTNNAAGPNGAKWVTPSNCNVSCDPTANQDYIYTTLFSLPNVAGLTAISLAGSFWSDNTVLEILLNGINLTVNPGAFHNGAGTVFGSTSMSQFVTGSNTLSFKVRNLAQREGNPSGLRASALVTAVPEPGTWLLMLMGFGFVGFQMRRRQKTQVRFQFA